MFEKIYELAAKEIGTTEAPGEADNPRILEYHSVTEGRATMDSVPWCSAFACWVLEKCGIQSPRSAWARHFLGWGKKLDKPVKGCIVVFKRNETSGHVGFYDHEDDKFIYVLGGNEDDQVKIKPYPKENLLGYRAPIIQTMYYADLKPINTELGAFTVVYRDKLEDCKRHVSKLDLVVTE